jgi:formylglycine-generating enzyme required for sulfatase activity
VHPLTVLSTLPVDSISFADASAYFDWKTKATGQKWRLPTEHEREKATRGVYGVAVAKGGVFDRTDSWFDGPGSSHVLRGGSWNFASIYSRAPRRY